LRLHIGVYITEKFGVVGCIVVSSHRIANHALFRIVAEEDEQTSYAQVLLKYFLSEGVLTKHALLVASADESPLALMKVC
jgi:hypothetical protein